MLLVTLLTCFRIHIKEATPYFFTLAPHSFHWFQLRPAHPKAVEQSTLPALALLSAALERSPGRYELQPTPNPMAQSRALLAIEHDSKSVQVMWTMTTREREERLLPIRIRAVPEGTVVPTHNALMTIESTDPQAYWAPSYLETMLLRIWYPITVATISWHAKQTIRQFLERTSDDPEGQLPFKLHDFGARGVSSLESAALGGAAHDHAALAVGQLHQGADAHRHLARVGVEVRRGVVVGNAHVVAELDLHRAFIGHEVGRDEIVDRLLRQRRAFGQAIRGAGPRGQAFGWREVVLFGSAHAFPPYAGTV